MIFVQWAITAGTAIFIALVAFFQWRTCQQKAALDLFERRHELYQVTRKAVGQIVSSSPGFDQQREAEFLSTMERAYFFFGDDVQDYLEALRNDILSVREADNELSGTQDANTRGKSRRREAFDRVAKFHSIGKPIFARYMRFSQTVRWIG